MAGAVASEVVRVVQYTQYINVEHPSHEVRVHQVKPATSPTSMPQAVQRTEISVLLASDPIAWKEAGD